MSKLTKQYIFKQKLAGKAILLTGYSHKDWREMIKLLCETGVLTRTNRGAVDKGSRSYNIHYWLTINNISNDKEMLKLGLSHLAQCYQLHINNCRGTPDENGETS